MTAQGVGRRRRAAFETFPRLALIAYTARRVQHSDHHQLSARVDTRNGGVETEAVALTGIVDRIGAGDAFAAGVLHALINDETSEVIARTGLALAVLKHSLPGDASLFRQADLDAYLAGVGDVRR